MKRILFFCEGITPTNDEAAAIAKFNSVANKPYEVIVLNAAANAKYGETDRLIPCDFVASVTGSEIPAIYSEIDTLDADEIPLQGYPATQALVSNGGLLNVSNSAGDVFSNSALHVEDGQLMWTNLPASVALVESGLVTGITATGSGNKVTLTVTNGKISAIALSA